MKKNVFLVLSVSCIVIVFAEVAALLWMWNQGYLSSDRLQDVQAALTGKQVEESTAAVEEQRGIELQRIIDERVLKSLQLETRETELEQQKRMVIGQRDQVLAEKQTLEQLRNSFQDQINALQQANSAAATVQARDILLAMQPADAVVNLMQIDLDRSIVLLRGMPEKSIAKILKEFQLGDDLIKERGREIFTALSQGAPDAAVLDAADDQLTNLDGR